MSGVSPALSKQTGQFFGAPTTAGNPGPGLFKKQESSTNLLHDLGIPKNPAKSLF
jgi:hypothetical protein